MHLDLSIHRQKFPNGSPVAFNEARMGKCPVGPHNSDATAFTPHPTAISEASGGEAGVTAHIFYHTHSSLML